MLHQAAHPPEVERVTSIILIITRNTVKVKAVAMPNGTITMLIQAQEEKEEKKVAPMTGATSVTGVILEEKKTLVTGVILATSFLIAARVVKAQVVEVQARVQAAAVDPLRQKPFAMMRFTMKKLNTRIHSWPCLVSNSLLTNSFKAMAQLRII